MLFCLIPILLVIGYASGFIHSINSNKNARSLFTPAMKSRTMKLTMLKDGTENKNSMGGGSEETFLQDIINPTSFDPKRILATVAGQLALTAASFAVGSVTNIDVLHLENLQTEAVILQETVTPALGIFAAIFTFSFLLRDVQLTGLQEFFRERKFYVLKTLGLRTDITSAIVIALVIALGEGFSDEVFFRGLCFSSIHTQLGDNLAIFLSALISGLAHIPLFGSNFFVESFLSLIYGAAYLTSGFNIVVPMTIHAIYSLVSMYSTWFFSTREINIRIESAKSSAAANPIADSAARFEAMAKAVSTLNHETIPFHSTYIFDL
jgi:membrane protease YdiL (CAAX protease family)